jgi:ribosomal-protein-alanine N-acetyltransferase
MAVVEWMRPDDTKSVSELSERCLEEAWSEQNFLDSLEKDYTLMAVAREGTQITGYVVVYLAADQAELESIAVDTSFRRCGAAYAMLDFIIREAKQKGVGSMTLEVRESNFPARALYEKFGFEILGKRKNFYCNPQEDALILGSDLHYRK